MEAESIGMSAELRITAEFPDTVFSDTSEGTFDENRAIEAWNHCLRQIVSIRSLGENWDGAGARPIRDLLIKTANLLLEKLRTANTDIPPSRIVATPSGSILFEWHTQDGYIEAEIEEPLVIEWMIQQKGKPSRFQTHNLWPKYEERTSMESVEDSYCLDFDVPAAVSVG